MRGHVHVVTEVREQTPAHSANARVMRHEGADAHLSPLPPLRRLHPYEGRSVLPTHLNNEVQVTGIKLHAVAALIYNAAAQCQASVHRRTPVAIVEMCLAHH